MEFAYYLRIVRLRWKFVAAFAVLGAVLAVAVTLAQSRSEPEEVNYWLAEHKLIVSQTAIEQGRFPNLLQTALLVTGGSVPETVAVEFGIDEPELTARVRTVADLQVNVIEISAVSLGAVDAEDVASAFSRELVATVDRQDAEGFQLTLDEARADVVSIRDRLDSIDGRILEVETQLDGLRSEAIVPLGEEAVSDPVADARRADSMSASTDELRRLRVERDTRAVLFEEAIQTLDDLERTGPPPPLLETLDTIDPYRVSEKVYRGRIKQGKSGDNNFNAAAVDDGDQGGLGLGQTVSNPAVRFGLGIVGGTLVGLGAVLMHLRFDPRLRTKAEIEAAFDLPVLAEIPKFDARRSPLHELHSVTRRRSMVTESYRMVRSALLFARSATAPLTSVVDQVNGGGIAVETADGATVVSGHEMRVMMVTSPGPSEGKTTTTANLAVVLAEAGYEVLVINCDYRLPKLHHYFDRNHEPRKTIDTGIPRVTLIADVADSNNPNPTAVVEAQRNLIRKARKRYDVVLLDTAPMLATNDASALLPVVDLVVLVAQEGKTDREAAEETVDLLRRRRANVAGVVVTGSSGFGRSRYYDKYRYGHYYDDDGTEQSAPAAEAPVTRAARAMVSQN
jgi:capsular exopolysaccharide synthesis family protein